MLFRSEELAALELLELLVDLLLLGDHRVEDPVLGADAVDELRQRARHDLERMLGFRVGIEMVAAGTFPRTDFKAKRVIEDRDLYRSLREGGDGPA